MPDAWYPWIHLLGRTLFAMVFIERGMNHLIKLHDVTGYARSRGTPAPQAATIVTGVMAIIGGVFIVLGWHRFIGAGLIAMFCVLTAFMMHNFWRDADPLAKQNEMSHFMNNLALAGAALFIAYHGGWGWPMSIGG